MSNCQFMNLVSVGAGTFESNPIASKSRSSSIHINVSPGAVYDVEIQISNDGVNFITYLNSGQTGLDSNTSEGANVIYGLPENYRFYKVFGSVTSGTPDIKAYLK